MSRSLSQAAMGHCHPADHHEPLSSTSWFKTSYWWDSSVGQLQTKSSHTWFVNQWSKKNLSLLGILSFCILYFLIQSFEDRKSVRLSSLNKTISRSPHAAKRVEFRRDSILNCSSAHTYLWDKETDLHSSKKMGISMPCCLHTNTTINLCFYTSSYLLHFFSVS